MTASLPHDVSGLAVMVFLLGLRHGMEPDHLATVDGLARHNARDRPRVARWSGCFFSLGHGVIVTLVAGFVAATLHDGAAPEWLERLGAWISIVFLLPLGIVNVVAGFRTPADRVVRPAPALERQRWNENSIPQDPAPGQRRWRISCD